MIGLYVHIPFCRAKCPYCDFYSLPCKTELAEQYTAAVISRLAADSHCFDTVYFGGGTPNLLGAERLVRILSAIRSRIAPQAEITTELNPTEVDFPFFSTLREGGFNRISIGLQSANADELQILGRKHSTDDVFCAVQSAKAAGFTNISLDLMLGVPGASEKKLKASIDFCMDVGLTHLSCYLLKIEEQTPFFHMKDLLALPTEDETCDLYLSLVREMTARGFSQYEISNFSLPGFESRHNLKYWDCQEYLGIGPAAHSFLEGKRFYYPRDLSYFLSGGEPIFDSDGGSFSEYAMLRLRLTEGLLREECIKRYSAENFHQICKKAEFLPPHLVNLSAHCLSFTPEGFLVSNTLLATLL
ncbi:MAG: radical SAM family heme chaperone HemW [Oscillospiraceae bacterium]